MILKRCEDDSRCIVEIMRQCSSDLAGAGCFGAGMDLDLVGCGGSGAGAEGWMVGEARWFGGCCGWWLVV